VYKRQALAGTAFDYLENAAVAEMLRIDPDLLTPVMVENASGWTFLKAMSHMVAMIGLLILGLIALYHRLFDQREADKSREAMAEKSESGDAQT